MGDGIAQNSDDESNTENCRRETRAPNPTDEYYHDEHVLITPATGTDERVALSVGDDPIGETPRRADARELVDALENYLEDLENSENEP